MRTTNKEGSKRLLRSLLKLSVPVNVYYVKLDTIQSDTNIEGPAMNYCTNLGSKYRGDFQMYAS